MKNNQIIVLALIGIGVYLLMNRNKQGQGSGGTGERTYTLPNGQRVRESQLPSYGYVQFQGQWYHQSQFPVPPNAPTGMTQTSPNWQQWLTTALSLGQQIIPMFSNTSGGGALPDEGAGGETGDSGGDTGGGGAGGGF